MNYNLHPNLRTHFIYERKRIRINESIWNINVYVSTYVIVLWNNETEVVSTKRQSDNSARTEHLVKITGQFPYCTVRRAYKTYNCRER